MSLFPFFSIPVLAQNEILKNLELRDLFLFSTLSKRSHKTVKSASIYFPCLHITATFNFDCSLFHMQLGNGNLMFFSVNKVYFARSSNSSYPQFDIENVYGVSYSRIWSTCSTVGASREVAFEYLMKYILGLFKKNKLDLTLKTRNIKNFRLWNVTKSLYALKIESEMSASEIEFVKKELKVSRLVYSFNNPCHIPFEEMNL